jgi:purine-binding chemotaxis protein CheW
MEERNELFELEDTLRGRFLTFVLGAEYYGIEIRYVTEIIGIQTITEVPELPDYMSGIINLRGRIIPVMDIRKRFKKEFVQYNDRTCIIVIDVDSYTIGLIIDSVSEVITIPDTEIVAPPHLNKDSNNYIYGVGKVGSDVKLLLDCRRLIDDNDTQTVRNI